MKSKSIPYTPTAKLLSVLLPVMTFGLVLGWISLKMQIERILRGGRVTVPYQLLILAGCGETWLIAAILAGIVVYVHRQAMRHVPDEKPYTLIGFGSGSIQIVILLFGLAYLPSSMWHLDTLWTGINIYHLAKGEINLIGGFQAYSVMECDSLGIMCTSNEGYLTQSLCSIHGGKLALDPETDALVIHIGSDTYPVMSDLTRDICRDVFRRALERR